MVGTEGAKVAFYNPIRELIIAVKMCQEEGKNVNTAYMKTHIGT